MLPRLWGFIGVNGGCGSVSEGSGGTWKEAKGGSSRFVVLLLQGSRSFFWDFWIGSKRKKPNPFQEQKFIILGLKILLLD